MMSQLLFEDSYSFLQIDILVYLQMNWVSYKQSNSSSGNPPSSSPNSLQETTGDKSEGIRVSPTNLAALEPSGLISRCLSEGDTGA
jgi:hypothetical protein